MKTKRPRKHGPLCVAIAYGALWLVSCRPAAPPLAEGKASVATLPVVAQPERGKTLYLAKCAKCHAFEKPQNYEVLEWRDEIMPVMARKARLDPADSSAVLAYILALRSAG